MQREWNPRTQRYDGPPIKTGPAEGGAHMARGLLGIAETEGAEGREVLARVGWTSTTRVAGWLAGRGVSCTAPLPGPIAVRGQSGGNANRGAT
jgi:hypothetical protein